MNIELTEDPQAQFDKWIEEVDILKEMSNELKKLIKKVRYACRQLGKLLMKELSGLLRDTAGMLREAFTVTSSEDQQNAAALYGQQLAQALYQLQISFSQLKVAVIRAAAPLVQVLLPAIQLAVQTVTQLANSIGYVLRMLFFGTAEAEDFTQSLSGVSAAGTKARKTLAGFDQITRLGEKGTSGGGIFSVQELKPLTGIWKTLADRLTELMAPLKNFDLTPAAQSLTALKTALEPLTRALFSGLEWAWTNLFVPLAQWTVEELLPVFLDTLTAALEALAIVIEELKPYFQWLWENFLQPLAQWAADQLIDYLQGITQELNMFSDWVEDNRGPVAGVIQNVKTLMDTIAQAAAKTLGWEGVTTRAGNAFNGLLAAMAAANSPFGVAAGAIGTLINTLSTLAEGFGLVDIASSDAWNGIKTAWENAWAWLKEKMVDPTYSGIKSSINALIGLINAMLRGLTSGVNYMAKVMNDMKFTVPNWIPLIGGKTVAFDLKTFEAPQIPYLAQGAVLPANKPFMAVVGDQRHGTNVEAPLSTIQEAVAAVLGDQIGAMMAGFQALLEENRRLRFAVESIEVGDSVIGAAAERYNEKMQMIRGGY